MVNKTHMILTILISCLLILSACTNSEESSADNEHENTNEPETSDNDTSNNEKENGNNTKNKTEDVKSDLGNQKVWFGGEVQIKEDEIEVNGKSNLLPGTTIKSSAVSGDWAVIDFQDTAKVEDDGSFSFTFPGRSSNTSATLSVYSADEERYGEHFENVTGNHVYLTETEGEFDVKTTYDINPGKDMPYTVSLEQDDWNKPDDYGGTNIWMEVDYTTDHDYIYFDVQSNIMEGAHVGGNLRNSSGGIIPFGYDYTQVKPDGSFSLKVKYHDLREGMYMPIKFEPDNGNNDWDHLNDTYGEKGEQLGGDLVKENDDGNNYVERQVEIVTPELDPPEQTDITKKDEEVKIQVPDDLLFDFDKSALKNEAKDTLDELISDLEELDNDTDLEINGHTDNEGDPDYNMELSKDRADAVMTYVKENSDLPSDLNIAAEGYGETDPIASNDDAKGRQRNRRVEIVVNPD